MLRAQVSRTSHVRLARDCHVRRDNCLAHSTLPAGNRSEVRMFALRLRSRIEHARSLASEHDDATVAVDSNVVVQRPDQCELIGQARLQREQLANINAWYIRRDGAKDATIFDWRLWFQIIRLKLG